MKPGKLKSLPREPEVRYVWRCPTCGRQHETADKTDGLISCFSCQLQDRPFEMSGQPAAQPSRGVDR